jgi:hypothetical protein
VADPHGVSIAFGDGPHVVTPTWTRIDTLAGCRVQSWSISRGRPSEFEQVSAGTATVKIIDSEGLFDPTNGGSTYFPNVTTDKQAAIALYNPVLAEWRTVFRGFVEQWNLTLSPTRSHLELDLELIDGLGYLVDSELMPGKDGVLPPPAGAEGNVVYAAMETPKDRIEGICGDVGWPLGLTDIFTGNVYLTQQTVAPGTDALSAMLAAADGEFPSVALLYCNREGALVFHGRNARFRPDVAEYGIRRQICGDPSLTSLDDSVCPISEMSFALGKSNLYNRVLAYPMHTAISGTTPTAVATVITEAEIRDQVIEDDTPGPTNSLTVHGTKTLSFTDLLTLQGIATGNTALEETLLFATYYRDNMKQPLPRISRLVFKSRHPSDPLADPLWRMLTRADISDRLTITSAHPGGGGFTAEDYYVEGLRYECHPGAPDLAVVTLELDVSPAALFDTDPFPDDPDPGP